METFDLIIIGAGPAGLSASIYASRYGIRHLVVGEVTGGLMTQTFEIGNWLGTENITGQEFSDAAAAHVKSYGAQIRPAIVTNIAPQADGGFVLSLADGKELSAKTLLSATGTHHRYLDIPGEKELAGKGVSYCPTCDGFFFKNKVVAIAGGGDSAAEAGAYLSNICSKVYIVVRGAEMRAEKFWKDLVQKKENVEVIFETNIVEIKGETRIDDLVLDKAYQGSKTLKADGLFVEIGLTPNTAFLKDMGVGLDEQGYVKVSPDQSTNIQGLWAAGDATTSSNHFRQIVTAASEGAIAANSILQHLQRGE
ncbi:MAG: FAD-dependent oxidoreductase [Candidatus Moranbacteria bacterium]|nr:FAD-dependent oxidoreductase [Candidatus Moranbacteria bacterium]